MRPSSTIRLGCEDKGASSMLHRAQPRVQGVDDLSRSARDKGEPASSATWLQESATAVSQTGPRAESLTEAWDAWIRQDSSYASHPLVSSSSFWSNAHCEVLSPEGRSGLARRYAAQVPSSRHRASEPAQPAAHREHTMSVSDLHEIAPLSQQMKHANGVRSSSVSDQQSQWRGADLRGTAPYPPTQKMVSPHSRLRNFEDGPGCSLALEPLTGDDTLPSSFHVESIYSRALLGGDSMSTWAFGSQQDTARSWAPPSQQDTARSRKPDPVSNPTTAPSSAASDRLPFHSANSAQNKLAQALEPAPRSSVSSIQSSVRAGPQYDAVAEAQAARSAAAQKLFDSDTRSSSSHYRLAPRHGSNQPSQARPTVSKPRRGSSLSHELPASRTVIQEASLTTQSSISGSLEPKSVQSTQSRIPRHSRRSVTRTDSPTAPPRRRASTALCGSGPLSHASGILPSHSTMPAQPPSRGKPLPQSRNATRTPVRPACTRRSVDTEVLSSRFPEQPQRPRRGGGETLSRRSTGPPSRRATLAPPASAARGRGRLAASPATRTRQRASMEADFVSGPRPPPQWNNPRANGHASRSPTPQRSTTRVAQPLSAAESRTRSNTPPRAKRTITNPPTHAPHRRGPQPAPAGSASAFACSPFALVPPLNMAAWPRKADVPPLFQSRNAPPALQHVQRPLMGPASPAVVPPNSLETLNAARPQRVAMRDSPDEPSHPMPRDPLTSFNSHHGTVTDDDLFRGGRALVPSSMDSVSTRAQTMTHRSLVSARGPGPPLPTVSSIATEDDHPGSAVSVNPYLPLYPGTVDSDGVPRGMPASEPATGHAPAAAAPYAQCTAPASAAPTTGGGGGGAHRPHRISLPMQQLGSRAAQYRERHGPEESPSTPRDKIPMLIIGTTAGTKQSSVPQRAPLPTTTIDAMAAAADASAAPTKSPLHHLVPPSRADLGPMSGAIDSGVGGALFTAVNSDSSATESCRVYGKDSDPHPRAVTPSARTLGLQSTYGSASEPVLPAVHAAESSHTTTGSFSVPPLLHRQLSVSTPKAILSDAPAGRACSNPPSSGPPSSSLGSPTSLEQLLPAQRHALSHGMNPDRAVSVGTLGTVTFAPVGAPSGSMSVAGGVPSARSDSATATTSPTPAALAPAVPDLLPHGGMPLTGAIGGRPAGGSAAPPAADGTPLPPQEHGAESSGPGLARPQPHVDQSGSAANGAAVAPGVTMKQQTATKAVRAVRASEDARAENLARERVLKGRSFTETPAGEAGKQQRVRVRAVQRAESEVGSMRHSMDSSVSNDRRHLRPVAAPKPRRFFAACCAAPQATRG
eukprot:jgi/Ulvmu1/74/UM001_0077.1